MRPITLAGPSAENATHLALVTSADLQEYLRDTSWAAGGETNFLANIVAGMNQIAFREMGERFLVDRVQWDQLLYGPGGQVLMLPGRPFVSIQSLEYGFMEAAGWRVVESYAASDYFADPSSGRLFRTAPWSWPVGPMCLRAKWHHGFAACPADLKHEMKQWGKTIVNRISGNRLDVTTVGHEAEVTSYRFDEMPDGLRTLLATYRLKEFAIG